MESESIIPMNLDLLQIVISSQCVTSYNHYDF